MSIFTDQKEFMVACDQIISSPPGLNVETHMWSTLIHEEYNELHDALALFFSTPTANALASVAKEAIDLVYVVSGLCNNLGFDSDAVFRAVHASNMSKIDKTLGKVRKRADGKVLKPEGYEPPDILGVITNGKYHSKGV